MGRQWDDWRCYRCNRWQRAEGARTKHLTPVGLVVSICADCARLAYQKVGQGP